LSLAGVKYFQDGVAKTGDRTVTVAVSC